VECQGNGYSNRGQFLAELEEGARIIGRLIGVERNQMTAGMPVKARYDDIDNEFTPINSEPVA
jgi:hypothetical protein